MLRALLLITMETMNKIEQISSRVNNEMIMGVSQPNNETINASGEDVMRSQVQTNVVDTSLP